jgi:hypothetical protein
MPVSLRPRGRFLRLFGLLLFLVATSAAQQPCTVQLLEGRNYMESWQSNLQDGTPGDRGSTSCRIKIQELAAHKLKTVVEKAKDEYGEGRLQDSIRTLNEGITALGAQPVLLYDLALSYYRLGQFENARHFLKLADAFIPSDRNVNNFEALRSLILSGSPLSSKSQGGQRYRELNRIITRPYLYAAEEDARQYDRVCKSVLEDHLRISETDFQNPSMLPSMSGRPAELLFDALKCAERQGYVNTAKRLVKEYESTAPKWPLDEEYKANRELILNLSYLGDDQAAVQEKLSRIMVASELRDYARLKKELDTPVNARSSNLERESSFIRARWLELSGSFDQSRSLMNNLLTDTLEEDPRFDEIKGDLGSMPTRRAQYKRTMQMARAQFDRLFLINGPFEQEMISRLAVLAGTLAQARRLFPYTLDANEMLAWTYLQLGNHRSLVESWDVASLHDRYVTLPACVSWGKGSACTVVQIRPDDGTHNASISWSREYNGRPIADFSFAPPDSTPEETRSLEDIAKVRIRRDGDIQIDFRKENERVVFSVETVFNYVYKVCGYYDTLFLPHQALGIEPLVFKLFRLPPEESCMPLEVQRARGNDLLIALVRYGRIEPLKKLSHDGLSPWEWAMIIGYSGLTIYNAAATAQDRNLDISKPMRVLLAGFLDIPEATEAVRSWRYALTAQRAGDPRVRTRFRVIPLSEPGFSGHW